MLVLLQEFFCWEHWEFPFTSKSLCWRLRLFDSWKLSSEFSPVAQTEADQGNISLKKKFCLIAPSLVNRI